MSLSGKTGRTTVSSSSKVLDVIEAELWRRMGEYVKNPAIMSNEGIYYLVEAILSLQEVRLIEKPAN